MNISPTVRILAIMEAGSLTGPAKNLLCFCRWLHTAEGARTGLGVTIATFDRNARAQESDSFISAARTSGIRTHVIRERFRFDLGVLPQVRRIIVELEPNIIQTHNNKSHLLVRLLPELRRNRLWFAFHHGDAHTNLKQRVYNHVDRVTLRSADRVVSVCEAFSPRLVACGVKPERILILHNAATPVPRTSDVEREQLRGELRIGSHEAIIVSIGRLSQEKGHADLLRALAQMRAISREWKLVIVGAGPERQALGRLAGTLGIDARVLFAGFQADVSRFYAVADVFALASHSEGSSNVLLEAMMARVPIAATRAGGTPEIVLDQRTGLLVPVADPQALGSAIARLLSEPKLASQLADAAFSRAEQEFSVGRYMGRLVGFYADALQQSNERTKCLLPFSRDAG